MTKYIYLLIITVAEATIGVFVKLSAGTVPIYTLNFYRVFFAALFLAGVLPLLDKNFLTIPFKMSFKNIKDILVIGALIALQISLFNIAMNMAPIANVVIFWSIAPFFVFILSILFLDEKIQKQHILIFLIALLGILVAKPLSGGYMLGNLIALATGATYGAMISYIRFERNMDLESPGLIFWYMFTAAILLSPALFIWGLGDITSFVHYSRLGATLPAMIWPIALGVFSTGTAFLFITLSLKKLQAGVYSLVDIVVSPLIAAFFGYLIFSEIPSQNMIYGGILLLAAGAWLTYQMEKKHRREKEQKKMPK